MIKFRQKEFGLFDDTLAGAQAGAAVGTLLGGGNLVMKKFEKKGGKVIGTSRTGAADEYNSLKVLGISTLVGAALGFLVGSVKMVDRKIGKRPVNDRLLDNVVENLKKDGFREGDQFTRDSKVATRKKTKVCIVVSRDSGEVKVGINTVNEPKLKGITDNMIRNYKNASVENTKMSDRFNDISIAAISDGSADAGFISGIASSYIHAGYPVYLVEVG